MDGDCPCPSYGDHPKIVTVLGMTTVQGWLVTVLKMAIIKWMKTVIGMVVVH